MPASMKVSAKNSVEDIRFGARPGRWSRLQLAGRLRRRRPRSGKLLSRRPLGSRGLCPGWIRPRTPHRGSRGRATLPYLNILFNGFVYDDDTQLVENPYVRSFHYLKEIFTLTSGFLGAAVSNYYRPMMTLGYLVCYKLFGMRAYGFHLVSLLLHVLVVCLVFALTERLTEIACGLGGPPVCSLCTRFTPSRWPGLPRLRTSRSRFFISSPLGFFSRWQGQGVGVRSPYWRPWEARFSCPAFQGAGDDSAGARHGL